MRSLLTLAILVLALTGRAAPIILSANASQTAITSGTVNLGEIKDFRAAYGGFALVAYGKEELSYRLLADDTKTTATGKWTAAAAGLVIVKIGGLSPAAKAYSLTLETGKDGKVVAHQPISHEAAEGQPAPPLRTLDSIQLLPRVQGEEIAYFLDDYRTILTGMGYGSADLIKIVLALRETSRGWYPKAQARIRAAEQAKTVGQINDIVVEAE